MLLPPKHCSVGMREASHPDSQHLCMALGMLARLLVRLLAHGSMNPRTPALTEWTMTVLIGGTFLGNIILKWIAVNNYNQEQLRAF